MTNTPQQPFCFLDLPIEIQRLIFDKYCEEPWKVRGEKGLAPAKVGSSANEGPTLLDRPPWIIPGKSKKPSWGSGLSPWEIRGVPGPCRRDVLAALNPPAKTPEPMGVIFTFSISWNIRLVCRAFDVEVRNALQRCRSGNFIDISSCYIDTACFFDPAITHVSLTKWPHDLLDRLTRRFPNLTKINATHSFQRYSRGNTTLYLRNFPPFDVLDGHYDSTATETAARELETSFMEWHSIKIPRSLTIAWYIPLHGLYHSKQHNMFRKSPNVDYARLDAWLQKYSGFYYHMDRKRPTLEFEYTDGSCRVSRRFFQDDRAVARNRIDEKHWDDESIPDRDVDLSELEDLRQASREDVDEWFEAHRRCHQQNLTTA